MIRSLDRATAFRLGRTFSAQAYGQFVTVAVQLALVPLLTGAWGTRVYGSWLLLSAIPFYLTFSDFGFTFVAKNAMVMAVAAGRREAALRVFQSIFALLCIGIPLLLLASVTIILTVDVAALLSIDAVSGMAVRVVLLLLVSNVLLYQLFLLICAGIRAENRPASEAMWAASARLGEGAAVALAVLFGGGVVVAAAAMVASRVLFLAVGYWWLRRLSAWLRLGFAQADRGELHRLSSPALAYMAMPIAQALLIQGPVLVIGGTLGAVAVVVFSTSRTLARLGTAGINMINNSVISEYSALAGAGHRTAFARLFRMQLTVTTIATLGYAGVVLAIAPYAMSLLTHDTVLIMQPFFLLVVIGVAAEMVWSAVFTPVAAVNRHRGVTLAFVVAAAAALALCGPLIGWLGLSGAALAVLGAHAAMIPICLIVARNQIHDR
ncbi:lipopolysaccharide biosynthesis protein [Sphingomonas radiodurans]|uniref:lipopolysaccharide biosynthesis protein n=1 Tax=Sphingomonas radiodurans TaxID=2890321 RepID=UPI001E460182|nr:teichoic acid transporter [Sphingomonas radiodurans]WBH17912.1 teichoic acid transporter [Sphingomonas radiodurans]